MPELIHESIGRHASSNPQQTALLYKQQLVSYSELQQRIEEVAAALLRQGIGPGERVAVYLPKQTETVYGLFGAAAAGACLVPINPLLKPKQVAYILQHCNVRLLITSAQRLSQLEPALQSCSDLHTVITVDQTKDTSSVPGNTNHLEWQAFTSTTSSPAPHRRIDTDMAAILYTSGSTGNPKGVVLSHRNMVAGAQSVATYLENTASDRVLAVLPLSFDAGLSQLTTMFAVGGSAVLMDYLLPRDVIRAVVKFEVTGLGAVPPLWNQLAGLDWPPEAKNSLRYITNTGGAMPRATTQGLRESLPQTDIFLMYGLTEAFRSTYLPPEEVDRRPDSIGKAIPHAEILVINEDGKECAPGEAGELVHRGALVAMGYWNDPQKTAERFKPCPTQAAQLPLAEMAVFSGDQVQKDEEGFLYFISRKDEMIKTSGYRVSPTEVEEIVYASGQVSAAAALGLTHDTLGQAILLVATPKSHGVEDTETKQAILAYCQQELPNFMVPAAVILRDQLPQNQNGKIDRRSLHGEFDGYFQQDNE
jgi:acyl-CoA ligase (AMP-forming) (exosortase A-associated)